MALAASNVVLGGGVNRLTRGSSGIDRFFPRNASSPNMLANKTSRLGSVVQDDSGSILGDRSDKKRKEAARARAHRALIDTASELPRGKIYSFLPRTLLCELDAYDTTNLEAAVWATCAALVFVDVSGFSTIASKLQQFTSEGAEELTFHLNKYFSHLIDIIYEFVGDVVLFSGDALMAAWFGDDLPSNSMRAVSCGVQLIRRASAYNFSIDTIDGGKLECSMGIHVGASAGEVSAMIIGGHGSPVLGQWKYVLAGQPVEFVGVAANLGSSRQLVLTQEISNHLREYPAKFDASMLQTEVNGESAVFYSFDGFTDRGPPLEEMLEPRYDDTFELREMAALFTFDTMLKTVSSNSPGQLRTVSTVFIKLCCLQSITEKSMLKAKLNQAVGIIQKRLSKVNGVLNKVVMDDKGILCLCLFGLPHHTHEDDAERSVNFSVKTSKRIHRAIGACAFGISRAKVFCGMTGGKQRSEYTVLGDGVNMAARLMSHSADFTDSKKRHVVCDEETMRAAAPSLQRNGICFIQGDEIQVKGKDHTLTCYHVGTDSDKEYIIRRMSANADAMSQGSSSRASTPSTGSTRSSCSSFGSFYSLASRQSCATQERTGRGRKKFRHNTQHLNQEDILSERSPLSSPTRRSMHSSVEDLDDLRDPPTTSSSRKGRLSLDPSSRRKTMEDEETTTQRLNLCPIQHTATAIGRKAELGAIQAMCESINRSRVRHQLSSEGKQASHRAFVIVGNVQMGKTFLLHKAAEVMSMRHVGAVWLSGSEAAMTDPYETIRSTVQKLTSSMEYGVSLEDTFPVLSFLHFVTRAEVVHLPDIDQIALPLEEKVDKINEALVQLFKMLGCWPVCFLIDDAQWVDGLSAKFIQHALANGCRAIFSRRCTAAAEGPELARTRTMLRKPTTDEIDEGSSASDGALLGDVPMENFEAEFAEFLESLQQYRLTAFDEEQTEELLRDLFNVEDVSSDLVHRLHEKTEGTPGLSSQIAQALWDINAIDVDSLNCAQLRAGFQLDEEIAHCVPSLETVVLRGVDLLLASEREALYLCSCLGNRFTLSFFRECLVAYKPGQSATSEVEGLVNTFIQAGFLTTEKGHSRKLKSEDVSPRAYPTVLSLDSAPTKPETVLFFVSPLARDAIYRSVLSRERRALHALIAEVLEQSGNAKAEDLVYHLRKAGEEQCARPHLVAAYQENIAAGRLREALVFLVDLTQSCPQDVYRKSTGSIINQSFAPAELRLWNLEEALCLTELGQLTKAQASLHRLFAALNSPIPTLAPQKSTSFISRLCSCCVATPDLPSLPIGPLGALRLEALALHCELCYVSGDRAALVNTERLLAEEMDAFNVTSPDAFRGLKLALGGPAPEKPLESLDSLFSTLVLFSSPTAVRDIIKVHSKLDNEVASHVDLMPIPGLNMQDEAIDHRMRSYEVTTRPVVRHTVSAFMVFVSILTGEGQEACEYVSSLRACGDERWKVYGLLLRGYVFMFYRSEMLGTVGRRHSMTLWGHRNPIEHCDLAIEEYERLGSDVAISILHAALRTHCAIRDTTEKTLSILNSSIEKAASLMGVITPFHAVAIVALVDAVCRGCTSVHDSISLPCKKYLPRVLGWLKQLSEVFPVVQHIYLLFEGVSHGIGGNMQLAQGSWRQAVVTADEHGTLQGVFGWRARACIVLDDNAPVSNLSLLVTQSEESLNSPINTQGSKNQARLRRAIANALRQECASRKFWTIEDQDMAESQSMASPRGVAGNEAIQEVETQASSYSPPGSSRPDSIRRAHFTDA